MIDIIELLKKDFPNHSFKMKNEDGNNVLYTYDDKEIVRWALISDEDFKNQVSVQSLEKELYEGIKNSVNKFLNGRNNV